GVRLRARPFAGGETLGPLARAVARHDAVEGPVDRCAGAEPRERPKLLIRRPSPLRLAHEEGAQLGPRRRMEPLAAPDRLPHLAQLLRPRSWALRFAAAEERGAHEL